MPSFCRLYSHILLCRVKNVVYLWCNSSICCQWQRLFTWLGFMCLVRLCHENCIKENYGFVGCQLCAVKMVVGEGGCWQCLFWQAIKNAESWAFNMSLFTSAGFSLPHPGSCFLASGKGHMWVQKVPLIASSLLQHSMFLWLRETLSCNLLLLSGCVTENNLNQL